MSTIDKAALLAELRRRLEADLESLERSQRDTQAAATHEEARPENDKDTRALEQSYLARGLAERVAQLRGQVSRLSTMVVRPFAEGSPVGMGAVVELEDDDGSDTRCFVAPAGGGVKLSGSIGVVTPDSPFGRALLGRGLDDEVELQTKAGRRIFTVLAIH